MSTNSDVFFWNNLVWVFTYLEIFWNIYFILSLYDTHCPEKLIFNTSIQVSVKLSVSQIDFHGITLEYFGNVRPPLK